MRLYHENGIKSHPVGPIVLERSTPVTDAPEINSNCGIGTVFERIGVQYIIDEGSSFS